MKMRLVLLLSALLLGLAAFRGPAGQVPRNTQTQVARQFLGAVLLGDYPRAYAHLAPEVRQSVDRGRFHDAAHPLWQRGRQRGTELELYKLGVRLEGNGQSRLFYAFTFAADSLRLPPPEWLEVTFRDTTARQVLSFGIRH